MIGQESLQKYFESIIDLALTYIPHEKRDEFLLHSALLTVKFRNEVIEELRENLSKEIKEKVKNDIS